MKKRSVICGAICALMLLTACQPTPDAPIVAGKDQDAMLQQAAGTNAPENSPAPEGAEPTPMPAPVLIREQLGVPEGRYTFESTWLDGRLTVAVDTAIQVPELTKMPITRVGLGKFSQEQVTGIFDYLFPEEKPFINGSDVMVKADYERAILEAQRTLADGSYAERGFTEEEQKARIEDLQKAYQTAPETSEGPVRSDGQLHWEDHDPMGAHMVLSTITDDTVLFNVETPATEDTNMDYFSRNYVTYWAPLLSPNYQTVVQRTDGTDLPADVQAKLGLSLEDAKTLCDSFFTGSGFAPGEFGFERALLVSNEQSPTNAALGNGDDTLEYGYQIYYARLIETIPTYVYSSWTLKDSGYAVPWGYEYIEFVISSEGIVRMEWYNPVTLGETLEEDAAMLPFEEIIAIFEEMMKVQYEDVTKRNFGENGTMEINVDSLRLCLVRIREQNAKGTSGLYVPAWVFEGHNKGVYGGDPQYDSPGNTTYDLCYGTARSVPGAPIPILIVNAIDGSVIDLMQGY